jgi:hypothetical protein
MLSPQLITFNCIYNIKKRLIKQINLYENLNDNKLIFKVFDIWIRWVRGSIKHKYTIEVRFTIP